MTEPLWFNILLQIIYVGRNPKDAALAYFSHYQKFYQYSGSQEQFFEAFYRDKGIHYFNLIIQLILQPFEPVF